MCVLPGSFSKILGPGLRLGWMLVPRRYFIETANLSNNRSMLASPSISQVISDKFVRSRNIFTITASVRQEYKKRGLAIDWMHWRRICLLVYFREAARRVLYLAAFAGRDGCNTHFGQKPLRKGGCLLRETFDPDGIKMMPCAFRFAIRRIGL